MFRALFLSLSLLLASFANALTFTTHGPRGGEIVAIAVAPADENVIYAGGGGGVFRSEDAGTTWRDVSGALHDVTQLAIHPADSNIVYAAAEGRIWKTTNAGASWSDITDGATTSGLHLSLTIDARDWSTLYFSSGCDGAFEVPLPQAQAAGVYKSTNGGASWQPAMTGLDTFGRCVQEFAADPASPEHLYIRSIYSTASESTDAAQRWSHANDVAPTRVIVDDPHSALTRYGINGTYDLPLVSNDGGLTWNFAAGAGLPRQLGGAIDLAIDHLTGRLFIATVRGIFRSGNGGVSWLPVDAPVAKPNRIVVNEHAGVIFLATKSGLYRAPLATFGPWTKLTLEDAGTNVVTVAADPNDPSLVYGRTWDYYDAAAQTSHGRIFRSSDYGRSWSVIHEADDAWPESRMAVDANGAIITTSTSRTGARLVRVDAKSGDVVDLNLPIGSMRAIATDPRDASTIYVATFEDIFVTHDGGATWRSFSVSDAMTIAIDPSNAAYVFAGTRAGLLESRDAGATWSAISPLWTERIAFSISHPSTLYRATRGTLWRSDDSGASWTQLSWPRDGAILSSLVVDPRDRRSLWLVSSSYGMWHSADAGVTWTQDGDSLPSIPVELIADRQGVMLHAATMEAGVWDAPLPVQRRRAATR